MTSRWLHSWWSGEKPQSLAYISADEAEEALEKLCRPPFPPDKFQKIADLLMHLDLNCGRSRTDVRSWQHRPRTYAVLRNIDADLYEYMDKFVAGNYIDFHLPFDNRTLPGFLTDPGVREAFLGFQHHVLTGARFLEFDGGEHQLLSGSADVHFIHIKVLGQGGFGQVDTVQSKLSFKKYARKRVPRRKDSAVNIKRQNDLIKEVGILKKLSHRHLVTYIGSYTDNGYVAYLMQPIADCNLLDFLEDMGRATCASDRRRVQHFYGCLASAVHYLHDNQSIRHTDITTRNVLIWQDRVFLSDFGTATDFSQTGKNTTNDRIPVSIEYIAPEVAHRHKRNAASDMWSLGVVFLEITTILLGKDLASFRSFMSKHAKHREHDQSIWANLPTAIDWLTRIMSPRVDSANEAITWVKNLLQDDPKNRSTARNLMVDILQTPSFKDFCCVNCWDEYESGAFEFETPLVPEGFTETTAYTTAAEFSARAAAIFEPQVPSAPMDAGRSESIESWIAQSSSATITTSINIKSPSVANVAERTVSQQSSLEQGLCEIKVSHITEFPTTEELEQTEPSQQPEIPGTFPENDLGINSGLGYIVEDDSGSDDEESKAKGQLEITQGFIVEEDSSGSDDDGSDTTVLLGPSDNSPSSTNTSPPYMEVVPKNLEHDILVRARLNVTDEDEYGVFASQPPIDDSDHINQIASTSTLQKPAYDDLPMHSGKESMLRQPDSGTHSRERTPPIVDGEQRGPAFGTGLGLSIGRISGGKPSKSSRPDSMWLPAESQGQDSSHGAQVSLSRLTKEGLPKSLSTVLTTALPSNGQNRIESLGPYEDGSRTGSLLNGSHSSKHVFSNNSSDSQGTPLTDPTFGTQTTDLSSRMKMFPGVAEENEDISLSVTHQEQVSTELVLAQPTFTESIPTQSTGTKSTPLEPTFTDTALPADYIDMRHTPGGPSPVEPIDADSVNSSSPSIESSSARRSPRPDESHGCKRVRFRPTAAIEAYAYSDENDGSTTDHTSNLYESKQATVQEVKDISELEVDQVRQEQAESGSFEAAELDKRMQAVRNWRTGRSNNDPTKTSSTNRDDALSTEWPNQGKPPERPLPRPYSWNMFRSDPVSEPGASFSQEESTPDETYLLASGLGMPSTSHEDKSKTSKRFKNRLTAPSKTKDHFEDTPKPSKRTKRAPQPTPSPTLFMEDARRAGQYAKSIATSQMTSRTRERLAGVNINRWMDHTYKLLELYCLQGKAGAVRMLLAQKCNPGTKSKPRLEPLLRAIRGASPRHSKCVRLLLEHGVDVHVKYQRHYDKTPLHLAIENNDNGGYVNMVHDMVFADVNPNARDRTGECALEKIFKGPEFRGLEKYKLDALALLLQSEADGGTKVNIQLPATLDTPLHLAVRRRSPMAVAMLLHKGADVNAVNSSGMTPLLTAALMWRGTLAADDEQILELLTRQESIKLDEYAGNLRRTALHHAVVAGVSLAVEILLERGADPTKREATGKNAAELATSIKKGRGSRLAEE